MTTVPAPAPFGGSDRQLGFIRNLLNERANDGKRAGDSIVDALNQVDGIDGEWTIDHYLGGLRDKREASRAIDWLMSLPRYVEAPAPVAESFSSHGATNTAMNDYFDRQDAQRAPVSDPNVPAPIGIHETPDGIFRVVKGRQSGNLYAKRMEHGAWVYVGRGPLAWCTEATLISYERAIELGQSGDWCIFDHPLEDPLSVVRGIGPTCERKHFPNAPRRTAQAKRDAEVAIQTEEGKARARAEFVAAIHGTAVSQAVA